MVLYTRKDMGLKRNNIKDRGVNRGKEEKPLPLHRPDTGLLKKRREKEGKKEKRKKEMREGYEHK